MSEKYIIHGTNSDLDDLEVAVGPACEFHYVAPKQTEFRKTIVLRQVEDFGSLTEDEDWEGIWVEDKCLRPQVEGVTETTVPGEHFRTFVLHVKNFEMTLVEYSDRLQMSVLAHYPEPTTLAGIVCLSEYKEIKHFGSIKLGMDECQTKEDVQEFMHEVKQL